MIELNDDYFDDYLSERLHPDVQKTVVIFYGSKSCKNCKETMENISHLNLNPDDKMELAYMDNTINGIMDVKYPEFYEMSEYPKTVIHYGDINNTEFLEGVVSVEKLKHIQEKAKNL